MFRKFFSASYAGHVVDDNLGFQGTPANDRRYPNEQGWHKPFGWALDFSQHLENLGISTSSGWRSTTFSRKAMSVSPTC